MMLRPASLAIALSISLLWPDLARAFSGGPPDAHTGAPGEETCNFCHLDFPLNSGTGSLTLLDLPESYDPGATYRLRVRLADPDAQRWGFELTALDAANARAGNLATTDNNTQVSDALNGRQYIKHGFFGTAQGTTGSRQWSIDWTAPTSGTGAVTFWFAGNAANNDLFNTGDRIYSASATLEENTATAAPSPLAATRMLGIVPNPFNPRTEIRFELARDATVALEVIDARGRRVRALADGWRSAGRHAVIWNGTDDLGRPAASGTYFARLVSDGRMVGSALTLVR